MCTSWFWSKSRTCWDFTFIRPPDHIETAGTTADVVPWDVGTAMRTTLVACEETEEVRGIPTVIGNHALVKFRSGLQPLRSLINRSGAHHLPWSNVTTLRDKIPSALPCAHTLQNCSMISCWVGNKSLNATTSSAVDCPLWEVVCLAQWDPWLLPEYKRCYELIPVSKSDEEIVYSTLVHVMVSFGALCSVVATSARNSFVTATRISCETLRGK